MRWLWKRAPEWTGKRPSELLAWQENAKGRQRYVLLDLMFEHV
jgi:hypothetical protein